jgi:hypothetical protein
MDDATGVRWCSKCQVLLRDVKTVACSAGGSHDTSGSGHYFLVTGPPPDSGHEGGWRSCAYCRAIYRQPDPAWTHAPPPTRSVLTGSSTQPASPAGARAPGATVSPAATLATAHLCPAVGGNGAHGDDGVEYSVRVDHGNFEQTGWRRCAKCWALFYGGGGNDNGTCVVDHKPHHADGATLVVEFERLATFPWPNAIGTGKTVELNYEAPLDIWSGASKGTWFACTPTELWAQSEWGGSAWGVHFTMMHGPKVWVQIWLNVHVTFLEIVGEWISTSFSSPPAVPCFNPGNFDPTDPQVEWDNGKNNNGVELELEAIVAVVRLWPKRNDRIRIDIEQLVPQSDDEQKDFDQFKKDHPMEVWHREYHLELDTSE